MFKLAVPGSEIVNYYFPSARTEFVVVEGTITEIREYNGAHVFNASELESPLTAEQIVALKIMKSTFEEELKKC